jgi:ribosomal protein S18 acetylase RimI-like enzyme
MSAGSGEVEVRRAEIGDLAAVAGLFDAYRVFYGQPSDPDRARRFMRERLTRGDSVVFLAFLGSAGPPAAGFVQMYPSFTSVGTARVWVLNDLYVDPAHRGVGVADRLMESAEKFAQDDGARSMSLLTAHDNGAARRLYERRRWSADEQFVRYVKRFG